LIEKLEEKYKVKIGPKEEEAGDAQQGVDGTAAAGVVQPSTARSMRSRASLFAFYEVWCYGVMVHIASSVWYVVYHECVRHCGPCPII